MNKHQIFKKFYQAIEKPNQNQLKVNNFSKNSYKLYRIYKLNETMIYNLKNKKRVV